MKTRLITTVRIEIELLLFLAILALAWVLGAWADAVDGLVLR